MGRYSQLKPHGFFQMVDLFTGKSQEGETVQCCHCGKHFFLSPQTTKDRGFCYRCGGFICGERCLNCVPIEAELEILEGTRNPTAVSVAVPSSAPKQLILPYSFSKEN